MSSTFGNKIKISIFGQSHAEGLGVVIDGLPAGEKIDLDKVQEFLQRRAPGGKGAFSTTRKESDIPKILSGLLDGVTCGAPLCAVFENSDTRSKDYSKLKDIPRPAHADFPAAIKHGGYNDIRGGGHFSARLTAPLCFAGAVCMQILERKNIYIGAHILSVGEVCDEKFSPTNVNKNDFDCVLSHKLPLIKEDAIEKMEELFENVRKEGDSIGGKIECAIIGMPVGVGEPMFDGIENRLSASIFAVPAVKGIEFGAGFDVSKMRGSENNDAFYVENGEVKTKTNNHGGILGGLSSGMPIIFDVAMKPTPSIHKKQDSVSLSRKENTELIIEGRHDVCIVPRAVPCIEAAAAIAICDLII